MMDNKHEINPIFRLYRFRSTDALIGKYEELNKEYFYFAPKEELNDPMEGFIPFYWQNCLGESF